MSALQVQFGSQIELSRTTRTIEVGQAPVNAWGPWDPSTGGPDASKGQAAQFLSADDKGWHGATLVQGEKGWLRPVRPDGSRVDAPWWTGKEWRKGHVRYAQSVAGAHPSGEVWPPEDAVRIMADRCTLTVRCIGSPSRCVRVIGSGNDLSVHCVQGSQSNLVQDLSAVYVEGEGNTVRGYAAGSLCGVFLNGPYNSTLGLTVKVEGIGADRGGVYFKRGSHGFKCTGTTVVMHAREWPCLHGEQGFYIDDEASRGSLYECSVLGPFTRGVFVHGGSHVSINRLRTVGCAVPYEFAPHFTAPTKTPTGNTARSVKAS